MIVGPRKPLLKVGQTFLSVWARDANDVSAPMCFPHCCVQDDPEDGRFFAALRMTCRATAIFEGSRSHIRPTCHPEEAALHTSDTSAGRLTKKDLLRDRFTTARRVRVTTRTGGTSVPGQQCRQDRAQVAGSVRPILEHSDGSFRRRSHNTSQTSLTSTQNSCMFITFWLQTVKRRTPLPRLPSPDSSVSACLPPACAASLPAAGRRSS